MKYNMTPNQARVLGALIEKSITTPEYYPLSLNALTNACNQKSSRDPVTSFSDQVVQSICQSLQEKHFVIKESSSRTVKYKHRFFNTEFGELKLNDSQIAVVCVMLLRGNQSAGELKTRCQRLFEFQSNEEVEQTLKSLVEHALGPFVKELPRENGKRDARWMHFFDQALNVDLSIENTEIENTEIENTENTNVQGTELTAHTQTDSTESYVEKPKTDALVSAGNEEFDVIAEIKQLKMEVEKLKLQFSNINQEKS
ncbi:YceH family protein [Marinicellulosiphila megalodicopiae]|uniref:YceH family protein n=1 Tax=Marinicellulosiphila megalodicopiae TaxID=2724896 RepID=UPI003BB17164